MEEYITKTREGYGSGIARPKIDEKSEFKLKGQFLKEIRDNTISGSENEDPDEHIEKVLKIVYLFHILEITQDKGAIPSLKAADAKKAIQDMVDHSQKWHNGTSTRNRSTKTFDGLAAIQAQLNNLGREIKKVNENMYAAQVGCELCKGPHYTKDCPLKEEGKTLEGAYYTQFGVPFLQGRQYQAAAPGFYQRNNGNPLYQERRQTMEESLSKFMAESAKRHEENSNLIKEI
ncbi:DNA-directed DNA polymerase [Tanacetum coccineum]